MARRFSRVSAFLGVCVVLESHALAVGLQNPEELSVTLKNNETVIDTYYKVGNPLEARSDLAMDKSGTISQLDDSVKEKDKEKNIQAKSSKGLKEAEESSQNITSDSVKGIDSLSSDSSKLTNSPLAQGGDSTKSLSTPSVSAASLLGGSNSSSSGALSLSLNSNRPPSLFNDSSTDKNSFLNPAKYAAFNNTQIAAAQKIVTSSGGALPTLKNSNSQQSQGPSRNVALAAASNSTNPSRDDSSVASNYPSSDSASQSLSGFEGGFPPSQYPTINQNSQNTNVASFNSDSALNGSAHNSLGSTSGGNASTASSSGGKTADTATPSKAAAGTGSSGKVDGCFNAKNDFYSKLGNTGSYTEEKEITDKDGKIRKQYCIKPGFDHLMGYEKPLENLKDSCPAEISSVFYTPDEEGLCVLVDDPPGTSSKSGVVDHNIGDILSNKDSDKGKAPVGWPSSH